MQMAWLVLATAVVSVPTAGARQMGDRPVEIGQVRKITLTVNQLQVNQVVLDLAEGRIVPQTHAAALHVPWVALPYVHVQRMRHWLGVGAPAMKSYPRLIAGLVDITFVPADKKGKPVRDYWGDKTCAEWPPGPWRKTLFYYWDIDKDHVHLPMLWRGIDGAAGLLQVVDTDPTSVTVEMKVLARPETRDPRTNPTSVTFPDGSYLEILAVSTDVTNPNAWLTPDGQSLPLPPMVHPERMEEYRSWTDEDHTAVGVVRLGVLGRHGGAGSRSWGYDNVSVRQTGSVPERDEFDNPLGIVAFECVKIAGEPNHLDFHYARACGPYITALRTQTQAVQTVVDGRFVEIETPKQTDRGFEVAVVHSEAWSQMNYGFVVVHRREVPPGQTLPSSGPVPCFSMLGSALGVQRGGEWMFRTVFRPPRTSGAPQHLDEVAEFRFQYRPYDRVWIRNIPLRAHVDAEIVIEKQWAKDPQGVQP